jgi:uncharacterized phiE125 gp8 family phage protein
MAQFSKVAEYTGTEIISRVEAKRYLRVDFSTDDDYIDELIKIARLQVLRDTNQVVVATEVDEYCRNWPKDLIYRLQYPGAITAVTIKYADSDNASQTMTAETDYKVSFNNGLPVVQFYNTFNLYDRDNAIQIQYTSTPMNDDTIRTLKVAMYMLIQHYYDNRSPVSYLKVEELPLGYKYLVNQYKNYIW